MLDDRPVSFDAGLLAQIAPGTGAQQVTAFVKPLDHGPLRLGRESGDRAGEAPRGVVDCDHDPQDFTDRLEGRLTKKAPHRGALQEPFDACSLSANFCRLKSPLG